MSSIAPEMMINVFQRLHTVSTKERRSARKDDLTIPANDHSFSKREEASC